MLETVNKRHSTRKYGPSKVRAKHIADSVEQARRAPSAGGMRAYKIVPTNKTSELATITRQKWIGTAPLAVALCANPERSASRYGNRGRNLYCLQDATLFGAYLDLLLVEKGYGTCWVGAFNEGKVKELLNIPDGLRPISLLIIGKKHEEKK